MSGEKSGWGRYETKVCPRCGAELYGDMHICYGCLYDFTRDTTRAVPGMPELPEECGEPLAPKATERRPCDEVVPRDSEISLDDTDELSGECWLLEERKTELGMIVRSALSDVWTPVPEEGLSVGRDPSNEVVLHAPTVSRHHLRACPTPDGMEVADLGSTNLATYQGREIEHVAIVSYGDSIDLCGFTLVMTGPKSN